LTWKETCVNIIRCVNEKEEFILYALIKSGGKQYKVKAGDVVLLEKIEGKVGDSLNLKDIVFLSDGNENVVGSENLSKANIKGTIVEQTKGDKVIVYKHKAKKGYRRKRGHRQLITKVHIDEINFGEKRSVPVEKPKKVIEKKEVNKKAEKAPEKKEVKKSVPKTVKKTTAKAATKKSSGKSTTKKLATSKVKTTSKPKAKLKSTSESKSK